MYEGIIAIKQLIETAGGDPTYVLIIIIALLLLACVPYNQIGKIEETEDKETGKKTYKIFRLFK